MEPMMVVLYSLMSTSVLLCVALAIAWRLFGRELHAALWSLAYGLSAADWTFNLLMVFLKRDDPVLTMLCATCAVGSFALIALGFRRRAGLPLRTDAIVAAAGVTVLFVGGALLSPVALHAQRWMVLFFCAAMLIVSARALRAGSDERRATGGAAFWMLVLFASYTIGLGIIAVLIPASGGDQRPMLMLFRVVAMMGIPTGLFGVGLFAMFLLAADLAEGMRRLASCDPLTGILNRLGLEQAAEKAIATCRRGGRPIAVAVADLDRFKTINDRFGHAVGDAVLRRFAEHAGITLREGDLIGRMGGEEFVFVLPDTDIEQALEAVERVRHGLAAFVDDLTPAGVTASFGIAMLGERGDTLALMLERADTALYRSKMEGRDRVTLAVAPGAVVERVAVEPPRLSVVPRKAEPRRQAIG
jgi:diguanylate cyclase (GGDEF)-like protein